MTHFAIAIMVAGRPTWQDTSRWIHSLKKTLSPCLNRRSTLATIFRLGNGQHGKRQPPIVGLYG